MTIAECQVETMRHIDRVRHYIKLLTDRLTQRGIDHDKCKLDTPEVELFAQYTDALAELDYGSEEYKENLAKLKPALDHHYANSRHHPEHFENGINDMTLVDIMEMLADWKASTERQHSGNILKSVEINAERFGFDPQMKNILVNTVKLFED